MLTLTDVNPIQVRKYYGSEGARKWALKQLEVESRQPMTQAEELLAERDYEAFMQVGRDPLK